MRWPGVELAFLGFPGTLQSQEHKATPGQDSTDFPLWVSISTSGSKKGRGEHWKLMTFLVLGNEDGEKQACRSLLLVSCIVSGQVGAPIKSGFRVYERLNFSGLQMPGD